MVSPNEFVEQVPVTVIVLVDILVLGVTGAHVVCVGHDVIGADGLLEHEGPSASRNSGPLSPDSLTWAAGGYCDCCQAPR